MLCNVAHQVAAIEKPPLAVFAAVRPVIGVLSFVAKQTALLDETLLAVLAAQWLVVCVVPDVVHQPTPQWETSPTVGTMKRIFVDVLSHMHV